MIQKVIVLLVSFLFIAPALAIEKKQINLDQIFWGSWAITNPNTFCKENYQFIKPGQFVYSVDKKQLEGEFAVIRNSDAKLLDVLILDIKKDNGSTGCGGDTTNYQGKSSQFSLKWISPISAEICTDNFGKQCSGLFLNKIHTRN